MRRLVRVSVRVLAVALAVSLLVVAATAFRVWQVARHDDRRHSDALVVLGASQFDGRPSEVFEARLRHAQALYLDGVAPVIVTVGGKQPGDRFSEGGAGKRFLEGKGVPASAVIAVETGSDTLQSLQAAATVLGGKGWRTVVLVTDPYHELRSLAIASDLGLDAVSSPTRQGPVVQQRSTQVRYVVRETAAYLVYRLFHRGSNGQGPRAV